MAGKEIILLGNVTIVPLCLYVTTFFVTQGVELLLNEEIPNAYGYATIVINWLPGVVAATHMISTYRTKLPARNTVSIACNN